MTFYMLDLRLRNSECGITVPMCAMKKKKKNNSNFHFPSVCTIYALDVNFVIYL